MLDWRTLNDVGGYLGGVTMRPGNAFAIVLALVGVLAIVLGRVAVGVVALCVAILIWWAAWRLSEAAPNHQMPPAAMAAIAVGALVGAVIAFAVAGGAATYELALLGAFIGLGAEELARRRR